jgi:hypothetical protein
MLEGVGDVSECELSVYSVTERGVRFGWLRRGGGFRVEDQEPQGRSGG